jgi:glycogen operon protein
LIATRHFFPRSCKTRAAGLKLIAEPWDLGPGGYQLGDLTFRRMERSLSRQRAPFRRGDSAASPARDALRRLAGRVCAGAPRSVNFITAHDGFTLRSCLLRA